MKKLIHTAMTYSIAAIAAGVFYREFTKFNGYTGETVLRYIHVHLFALGDRKSTRLNSSHWS